MANDAGIHPWVQVRRKEIHMLDNNAYNLMTQMVEENKSLWRIRNAYTRDATTCGQCQAFWEKLAKDKEDHIKELQGLLKTHLK